MEKDKTKGETTVFSFSHISGIMGPIGKNFVEVEFKVKAEVPPGVTVRLSGSVSQLGYSSPSNSIPLYTSPTELIIQMICNC